MQAWRNIVKSSKYQIYLSRSNDPFVNLSIEHFLLQKSHPNSTLLFLYVNRPCAVIGRNQNPWLEVNLDRIRQNEGGSARTSLQDVQLVRRRSGGGAVFHDQGNLNYSVICPPAAFTRDKHAEMVAKAIRTFNDRARVNERHDIVLDQASPKYANDESLHDLHRTKYYDATSRDLPSQTPLKVSGSAYKMIRERALHHGTCLLASPNLNAISDILKAPSRPYMKARGVESVRSPIGNIWGALTSVHLTDLVSDFKRKVIAEFVKHYNLTDVPLLPCPSGSDHKQSPGLIQQSNWTAGYLGDELLGVDEIQKGVDELKSASWIFGQTPQFTLSSHPTEEDDRQRPPNIKDFPEAARMYLKVKGGSITETNISIPSTRSSPEDLAESFNQILQGRNVHEIDDFRDILAGMDISPTGEPEAVATMRWLNRMFGKGYT